MSATGHMPRLSLVTCLCLCLADWTPLRAQVPDPLQVDKSVYAALSRTFVNAPETFLILLDPAITTDGWSDTPTASSLSRLSSLVNQAPAIAPLFTPTDRQASTVYEQILRNGAWGNLILDKLEQQTQAAANKLLYKDIAQNTPTPGYAQYLQLKDQYTKLQAAWDATPEENRTETMRTTLNNAKTDLDLRGNAAGYENALETLQSLSDLQPSSFRARLISRLEGATSTDATGARAFPTAFAPSPSFDYSRSWTTLNTDISTHEDSLKALAWPNGSVGPWRYCKTAHFDDSDDRHNSLISSGPLTFETQMVSVDRLWLDDDLFTYRGWKMPDSTTIISDGQGSSASTQQALLPLLITGVILARNITFNGVVDPNEIQTLLTQRSSGLCTSFGPFVLTGSTVDANTPISVFRYGTGFYTPNTQVIALLAKTVPKSPSPDLQTYAWH
jgi:hypothetical protein